jgi:hypothetical protein
MHAGSMIVVVLLILLGGSVAYSAEIKGEVTSVVGGEALGRSKSRCWTSNFENRWRSFEDRTTRANTNVGIEMS